MCVCVFVFLSAPKSKSLRCALTKFENAACRTGGRTCVDACNGIACERMESAWALQIFGAPSNCASRQTPRNETEIAYTLYDPCTYVYVRLSTTCQPVWPPVFVRGTASPGALGVQAFCTVFRVPTIFHVNKLTLTACETCSGVQWIFRWNTLYKRYMYNINI